MFCQVVRQDLFCCNITLRPILLLMQFSNMHKITCLGTWHWSSWIKGTYCARFESCILQRVKIAMKLTLSAENSIRLLHKMQCLIKIS